MRDFLHVSPTQTMKDLVTITNLNAISSQFEDSLDVHRLSSGIIWSGNELIENTNPRFQINVPIPTTNIRQVHFQNIKLYYASINKLINIDDMYLDLSPYKFKYLAYLVMYDDLSYDVVLEKPEDYQSNRITIARIYKPTNQIEQFFFCPPHVCATHYELSYPWYEFIDGGEPDLLVNNTIALGPTEIKYPSLNFSHRENKNVVIFDREEPKKVRWSIIDNGVDYNNLNLTINTENYLRNNKTITAIPKGKFSLSRLYLDPYENVVIQQYATQYWETLFDAMTEYQTYHQPDPNNKEDYIPLGAIIYESQVTDLTDRDKVRWYTNHDKSKQSDKDNLFAIDLVVREILEIFQKQTDERFKKVEARCTALENRCTVLEQRCTDLERRMDDAELEIDNLWETLNNHLKNTSNPHKVKLTQLYSKDGKSQPYDIATQSEAIAGSSSVKLMTPSTDKANIDYYTVKKYNPASNTGAIEIAIGGTAPSSQSGKTILWFNPI